MPYLYLFLAIICEVIGTSFLPKTDGFKKFLPSTITLIAYVSAVILLSISAKSIPIATLYAIWAGLGIVLIAIIGFVFLGQKLDLWSILGIILITTGVIFIKVFSKSSI